MLPGCLFADSKKIFFEKKKKKEEIDPLKKEFFDLEKEFYIGKIQKYSIEQHISKFLSHFEIAFSSFLLEAENFD